MKKKKKKTKISTWKPKLWKVFADYIKERDNWTCITCGKRTRGPGMNAGHYIAKGACGADYYFSEINVNAQCVNCNLKLEGARNVYRIRLIQKYGLDLVLDIEQNYWRTNRVYPYEKKMAEYKDKLKLLTEGSTQ